MKMKPEDIRDASWNGLKEEMVGVRYVVWGVLRECGPATTRQLAELTRMDLLIVRPRVTELCQLGFAALVGRENREGVYVARSFDEARRAHAEANGGDRQLAMEL